jgi:hypothetical protein
MLNGYATVSREPAVLYLVGDGAAGATEGAGVVVVGEADPAGRVVDEPIVVPGTV